MTYDFSNLKKEGKGVEEWLKKEYGSLRTGRANPAILDNVLVESYGSMLPINQVASISTDDAKSLRISPWDISQTKNIEKAISTSGLGLSIVVNDKGIRVMFPELTTERRASLIKASKQKLEEARVSLRGVREKIWGDIQAREEKGEINEDDKFRLKNEMQKIIDDLNKNLDSIAEKKEVEITN